MLLNSRQYQYVESGFEVKDLRKVTGTILSLFLSTGRLGAVWRRLWRVVSPGLCRSHVRNGRERGLYLHSLLSESCTGKGGVRGEPRTGTTCMHSEPTFPLTGTASEQLAGPPRLFVLFFVFVFCFFPRNGNKHLFQKDTGNLMSTVASLPCYCLWHLLTGWSVGESAPVE